MFKKVSRAQAMGSREFTKKGKEGEERTRQFARSESPEGAPYRNDRPAERRVIEGF